MKTVREVWEEGEFGTETSTHKRKGGGVAEMICRHIARIAGAGSDAGSWETEEHGAGSAGTGTMEGTKGCVCIVWVKAHGGGVAPNAYADAIAKSHLAEDPEDVEMWRLPRASILMAKGEDGKYWAVLADKPVRRMATERITKAILDTLKDGERAAGREVGRGEGCDKRVLRAVGAEQKAGSKEAPTGAGMSGMLRGDDVGTPTGREGKRRAKGGEVTATNDGEDMPIGSDGEEMATETEKGGMPDCPLCGMVGVSDGMHAMECKKMGNGGRKGREAKEKVLRRLENVEKKIKKSSTESLKENTRETWQKAG